ncbi:MAG: PaaI family thioesterase [Aliidongia sp.]
MDETLPGFVPLVWPGFCTLIGPLWSRPVGDGPDVVIGLRIEPRHANSGGYAHGGLISTLADIALTHAILRRCGPEFLIVTVQHEHRFHRQRQARRLGRGRGAG